MKNDKLTFGIIIFMSAILLIPFISEQNAYATTIRIDGADPCNFIGGTWEGGTTCTLEPGDHFLTSSTQWIVPDFVALLISGGATLTIDNGSELINQSVTTIVNDGVINNRGVITNFGFFQNNALIFNEVQILNHDTFNDCGTVLLNDVFNVGAGQVTSECEGATGSITIAKETIPDGDPQVFDFGGDFGPFQLSDGAFTIIDGLEPGEYLVTEIIPEGWDIESIDCFGANGATFPEPGQALITVTDAEETCTFTNIKVEPEVIEVGACGPLSVEGATYQLTNGIVFAGSCFTINADDIVFDGNGHGLNGELCNGSTYGVGVFDSDGVTVMNLHVFDFDEGILYSNSNDGLIQNNFARENCDDGIKLENSDRNIVVDNVVSNNGDDGIGLKDISNDEVGSDDNQVIDNFVGGNSVDGIDLEFSDGNLFSGNVVGPFETVIFDLFKEAGGNGDDGIEIDDSNGNTFSDNTVSHNGFGSENDGDGINLEDSDDNKFLVNTVTDNDGQGIDLDDNNTGNTFSDNTITNNDNDGVDLDEGDDNNTFTGNDISNNKDEGVDLEDADHNTFTGNSMTENGSDGIELDRSKFNVISNNNISSNGNDGVDLDHSVSNTFSCNTVNDNGHQLSGEGGAGIKIEENTSTDNEVFLNEIKRNVDGVRLSNGAFGNTISDNNIINNEDQLQGGADNTISQNFWGGDVPGQVDDPAESPVDLSECGIEPEPEPTTCEMYAGMSTFGNGDPQNGSLATVNLETGDLHEVGPAVAEIEDLVNKEFEAEVDLGLSGIAFNSDMSLFGSMAIKVFESGGDVPLSALVELDPITGRVIADGLGDIHPIVDADGELEFRITDLAFHPETDVLYGTARIDSPDISWLVTIDTATGEATLVGALSPTPGNLFTRAGGLSFLSDGTLVVVGTDLGHQNWISFYSSLEPVDNQPLIPDKWGGASKFDGLGVSCNDEIYATTSSVDSIYLITVAEGEGAVGTTEEFAAGAGTNSGDVDFLDTSEPEPEPSDSNGGDNQWDTRPTFGVSHEDRNTQVVETGFTFNTNEYMLTDNHHTDFAEQEVEIGTANSFSATVYADKKLKIQEFLFGIPTVGEAHLAELGVEIWFDNNGEIEDVIVVQNSDVIDVETVSVSHEMTKCLPTDAEAKCDTTTVSMTFLEPLLDKVMAVKAIDYALRDQRTFLNEGFDISGESLNPMLSNVIPSNVRNEGLLLVTQVAKYSPYWSTEDGRMFEMNSFGSFKQINQSFERFQDTGNAYTRLHSGFGGIIAYEQDRALDVFDSTKLISELPDSFGHHFDIQDRITDEMIQEMLSQEKIAQAVLDEMDKQNRFY